MRTGPEDVIALHQADSRPALLSGRRPSSECLERGADREEEGPELLLLCLARRRSRVCAARWPSASRSSSASERRAGRASCSATVRVRAFRWRCASSLQPGRAAWRSRYRPTRTCSSAFAGLGTGGRAPVLDGRRGPGAGVRSIAVLARARREGLLHDSELPQPARHDGHGARAPPRRSSRSRSDISVPIIEDGFEMDLRWRGEDVPPLAALDRARAWWCCSSPSRSRSSPEPGWVRSRRGGARSRGSIALKHSTDLSDAPLPIQAGAGALRTSPGEYDAPSGADSQAAARRASEAMDAALRRIDARRHELDVGPTAATSSGSSCPSRSIRATCWRTRRGPVCSISPGIAVPARWAALERATAPDRGVAPTRSEIRAGRRRARSCDRGEPSRTGRAAVAAGDPEPISDCSGSHSGPERDRRRRSSRHEFRG